MSAIFTAKTLVQTAVPEDYKMQIQAVQKSVF